ncbi:MAG: TIGR03960 family B12-binding radical SAM protein [Treponema sp.]|nr:TIGR03960 family B12-binding radical SAM protein [Treponema sp.]
MKTINPLEIFGSELCGVQNPSSYIGGEFGAIIKKHEENDSLFNFAIAFPDVYDIGMSNQAIKIIYNGLNKIDSVRCERVFAVEKDFEDLLKKHDVAQYTLETGIPLNELDMLGFSIGYELGITGVLSILDLGRIPILKSERSENDPIVIAGGCGATNPAPFADFFDAIFIGEAEGGMFELIKELSEMKKNGATRQEIFAHLAKNPHVWTEGMSIEKCSHAKAFRAVWSEFGTVPSVPSFMPLPNTKPVHDHGVVEIMRGCPNGCRFCHAGVYYRPQRAKTKKIIFDEVDRLVNEGGYKEISLTSLSSADYPNIENLLDDLNKKYKPQNVSFQLPSLKVNSFSLPLLEKLSEVRKSGLTFAVETPEEAWQLRLNKEVYAQHLEEIIIDAKKRGWKQAKFYFMVGLPFPETEGKTEEQVIVDFMLELQAKTRIQCNVNVGTFIPKPHTAYQWVRQISPEESDRKLSYIREHLPKGRFHVGTHAISTSFIEGLISRGDKRAGKIILSAYKKGARLDAWENHLRDNMVFWNEAFDEADFDVRAEILRERSKDEILPWDDVSLGPAKTFYKNEWTRNCEEILTPKCAPKCDHKCGVCNDKTCVNIDNKQNEFVDVSESAEIRKAHDNIPVMYRAVFQFTKSRGGEFYSHLTLIETFNRAIQKSALPFIYTVGFNPLPRLEFATTLSLGIQSDVEIASTVLFDPISEEEFIGKMNENLPDCIQIKKCFIFPVTNQRRRESLSSALWGNIYDYSFKVDKNRVMEFFNGEAAKEFLDESSFCSFDFAEFESLGKVRIRLVFKKDRPFRNALEEFFGEKIWNIASIRKVQTLAIPSIIGWTPEMNADYQSRLDNMAKQSEKTAIDAEFKHLILHAKDNKASEDFTDYFELYERIALINETLIKQRDERIKLNG